MGIQDDIYRIASENYASSTPWPEADAWHKYTFLSEKNIIEHWLLKLDSENVIILNAGSGGTEYNTKGSFIHLDIIESYINKFDKYIVGSIDNINLGSESVDGVICVGSVLNYADAQRAISEFSRVLKPNGFFILEFERSNSAEFLGTPNHGKQVFSKEYSYNGQTHLLWLYNENHIRQILKYYNLKVRRCKRIHSLSSLLNRFGLSETKSAPYSRFDALFQVISYPIAHNVLLLGTKVPYEKI